MTILGYVQRGGTPSAADRLLATRLGTACAELIEEGVYGVMVAARGDGAEPVPLEKVAGKIKTVPLDHPWVKSARRVGDLPGRLSPMSPQLVTCRGQGFWYGIDTDGAKTQ